MFLFRPFKGSRAKIQPKEPIKLCAPDITTTAMRQFPFGAVNVENRTFAFVPTHEGSIEVHELVDNGNPIRKILFLELNEQ